MMMFHSNITLRDYQQTLYDGIVGCLADNRSVLGVAPCGAGKSYVFAKMVEQARKGYVLILTHRQELLSQHDELLKGLGITNYRLAMVMTEANRLGQYESPSLIICDEAHLSMANSWLKVLQFYKDAKIVGLTATPCRLDGRPLGDAYERLIDSVSVRWLIDNHRLAPYEYYAPMTLDMADVRTGFGDYILKDVEQLMTERAIYSDAIKSWKELANGEKTIAYCISVKHAQELAEKFNSQGIKADWLCGGTPVKERERVMKSFREGDITVLCNVGIISEGVSIDDVTCCLMLRPTESIALGVQQMMRCMRYLPDKVAKVIDCVGNYSRIGLPDTERHWSLEEKTKKIRAVNEEGNLTIRVCPSCFMTFRTSDTCPFCGEPYPLNPREIEAHEEIRLRKIEAEEMERLEQAKKQARMEVGRCKTMADLWKVANQRGYKAGWVFKMARLKGIK